MTTPLQLYYTTQAGPGGSAEQPVPAASLGGYAATTLYGGGVLHDLFNRASSVDAADARADYRALYLYNPDPAAFVTGLRAYVTPRTPGGGGVTTGPDPRPATYMDSPAPQGVSVPTAYVTPPGVAFAGPTDYATGVPVGDLFPASGRTIWVRRVPAGPGAAADACDLTLESSTGAALVRRLYWETEPYADLTRPVRPPTYTPTPSPFRRVGVDFLSTGGARFTWTFDPSLTDPGPYVLQLQVSESGADAGAWADVGPPSQDPCYLLDPTRRVWSMTPVVRYRAVLTTAVGVYTSPPADVFGRLDLQSWLQATEVLRKEQLNLRRFVGLDGFLLKARRTGTRCSCVNQTTGEVMNSSDPICLGTGFVGGLYAPVPLTFSVVPQKGGKERVAYNEEAGTVKPVTITGRFPATEPIVTRDVWVALTSDDRYYIHAVKEAAAYRGVPVIYDVELRLIPRSDVMYTFPLTRPDIPPPDWRRPVVINL